MERPKDNNGVAVMDKWNLARTQAIVALKHASRDLSLAKTPEQEAVAVAACRAAVDTLEGKGG